MSSFSRQDQDILEWFQYLIIIFCIIRNSIIEKEILISEEVEEGKLISEVSSSLSNMYTFSLSLCEIISLFGMPPELIWKRRKVETEVYINHLNERREKIPKVN